MAIVDPETGTITEIGIGRMNQTYAQHNVHPGTSDAAALSLVDGRLRRACIQIAGVPGPEQSRVAGEASHGIFDIAMSPNEGLWVQTAPRYPLKMARSSEWDGPALIPCNGNRSSNSASSIIST